jgi:hypothetical protein
MLLPPDDECAIDEGMRTTPTVRDSLLGTRKFNVFGIACNHVFRKEVTSMNIPGYGVAWLDTVKGKRVVLGDPHAHCETSVGLATVVAHVSSSMFGQQVNTSLRRLSQTVHSDPVVAPPHQSIGLWHAWF